MVQRILIPLDGSLRAEQAIPVAARLARASSHSSIILVRVVDVFPDFSWQIAEGPPDLTDALEVARANANAYLEKMATVDVVRGLNVTTRVIEGKPADAILDTAQSMQADLIVMSSHGHTSLKRWVLGSVAQAIERHSAIPVLLLRDQVGSSERILHRMTGPIRVMVALDGTPLSEAVLPVAAAISADLSSPLPGALHLAMMVPEPLQEHGSRTTGTYTKAIQGAQSYLNRLSKRLRHDPQVGSTVEITSSISLQSKVSETLVKLAEIGAEMKGVSPFTGYDLIAMATHEQENIDRWLYASATEQVLDATKVPVLVIRPERTETGAAYDTNNTHYGSFAV